MPVILVVDDEPLLLDLLCEMLAREKRPDMPIVLMSGKVIGRPGFPVIRKPFSQPQLAEIVGPIIRP